LTMCPGASGFHPRQLDRQRDDITYGQRRPVADRRHLEFGAEGLVYVPI
jgi:hypothetical protein